MTTLARPLLPLAETRIRDESRIAAAIAAAYGRHRLRILRMVLLCVGEYDVELGLIGLRRTEPCPRPLERAAYAPLNRLSLTIIDRVSR